MSYILREFIHHFLIILCLFNIYRAMKNIFLLHVVGRCYITMCASLNDSHDFAYFPSKIYLSVSVTRSGFRNHPQKILKS